MYPSPGEVLDVGWTSSIVDQQIHAAGWAGSVIIPLIPPYANNDAVASVSLPNGAFGASRPPMVWAFVQYGSVVIYKNFSDYSGAYVISGGGLAMPEFKTWIEQLHYDNVTVGGTTFPRWSFTIGHRMRAFVPGLHQFKAPVRAMVDSFYPEVPLNPDYPTLGNLCLHWYAVGVDTSSYW
jgi:hypothetical protein